MECRFRNDSKTIKVYKKTFHLSDVLLRVYGWYGNLSEEFCISYTVKRNALIFGMKMGYWKQNFFPALGPVTESRLHLTQIRIFPISIIAWTKVPDRNQYRPSTTVWFGNFENFI